MNLSVPVGLDRSPEIMITCCLKGLWVEVVSSLYHEYTKHESEIKSSMWKGRRYGSYYQNEPSISFVGTEYLQYFRLTLSTIISSIFNSVQLSNTELLENVVDFHIVSTYLFLHSRCYLGIEWKFHLIFFSHVAT